MTDPVPAKLSPDYFDAVDKLPWTWAADRLADERNYWLVSTRRDGRPYSRPLWGIWQPEGLFLSKGDVGRAAHRPGLPSSIHTDDARNAVIVEGVLERVGAPAGDDESWYPVDPERLREVAVAYRAKYAMPGAPASEANVNALLRPQVVFAWREAPTGHEPDGAGKWVFPTG